jgi:hypothetical protein
MLRRSAERVLIELGIDASGTLRVYVNPAAPKDSAAVVNISLGRIMVLGAIAVCILLLAAASLIWQ